MKFGLSCISGIHSFVTIYDTQEPVEDFYARIKIEHPDCHDICIDDVFYNQEHDINWKQVIAPNGTLCQEAIDLLNSEDEFIAYKMQFVNDHQFNISFKDISDAIEARFIGFTINEDTGYGEADELVDVRYGYKYPQSFICECVENTPQWKALDDMHIRLLCETYFGDGFAHMLSDQEINGVFRSDIIGDVFLVKWNKAIEPE